MYKSRGQVTEGYFPPYRPSFNSIEELFAELKAFINIDEPMETTIWQEFGSLIISASQM